MKKYCADCGKPIHRYWQKAGGNGCWHKQCWDACHRGYEVATDHCFKMNARFNLPTPDEIYWATNPYNTNTEYNTKLMDNCVKKIKSFNLN